MATIHALAVAPLERFLTLPERLDDAVWRELVAPIAEAWASNFDGDPVDTAPLDGSVRLIDNELAGLVVYEACVAACAIRTGGTRDPRGLGHAYSEFPGGWKHALAPEGAAALARFLDEVVRPDAIPGRNPFWLQLGLESSSAGGGLCAPSTLREIVDGIERAGGISRLVEPYRHTAYVAEAVEDAFRFAADTAEQGLYLLVSEDAT